MDFFEAQARAKKRTSRLVALFVLAVLGTILAGYGVALLVVLQAEGRQPDRPLLVEQEHPGLAAPRYWRPDVFTPIALCTIVVVSLGSLYKWWQFRHGGSVIAESLGARRIKPQTTDLAEQPAGDEEHDINGEHRRRVEIGMRLNVAPVIEEARQVGRVVLQ